MVSNIDGVSSRLILNALCDGEGDPEVLADHAKLALRRRIPQLREAVPGRFNEHHAILLGELLAHLDYLADLQRRLDARVDELMVPFERERDLLVTIPGVQKRTAEIVIAEIGVDMGPVPHRRPSGASPDAAAWRRRPTIGHHLLVVIWWMLKEHVPYNEVGDHYLTRRVDPERRQRQLVHQLEQPA